MAGQCCCGRIVECEELIQINDYVHEPLGPEGNFCGKVQRHTIRDQDREIERLMKLVEKLGGDPSGKG